MLALQNNATWLRDLRVFSTWIRLIRTLAWVYRFVHNCQLPREKRITSKPTVNEIEGAKIQEMNSARAESFGEDYSTLARGKTLPVVARYSP